MECTGSRRIGLRMTKIRETLRPERTRRSIERIFDLKEFLFSISLLRLTRSKKHPVSPASSFLTSGVPQRAGTPWASLFSGLCAAIWICWLERSIFRDAGGRQTENSECVRAKIHLLISL